MFIGHRCIFSGEMSIQIFYFLKNVSYFRIEVLKVFYILWSSLYALGFSNFLRHMLLRFLFPFRGSSSQSLKSGVVLFINHFLLWIVLTVSNSNSQEFSVLETLFYFLFKTIVTFELIFSLCKVWLSHFWVNVFYHVKYGSKLIFLLMHVNFSRTFCWKKKCPFSTRLPFFLSEISCPYLYLFPWFVECQTPDERKTF